MICYIGVLLIRQLAVGVGFRRKDFIISLTSEQLERKTPFLLGPLPLFKKLKPYQPLLKKFFFLPTAGKHVVS